MPGSPRRFAGRLAALAAAAVIVAAAPFAAAAFPTKPVTLVIPYAAGGSTETLGRVFAEALGRELGQPVVVQTRPGGGGAVGATLVAKAEPDGHTLLFAATASLLWPPLTQNVEYDLDSFRYVAQISEYQQAIVARADAPFDDMAGLIAYSRDHPGLNYADQSAMSRAYIDFIAAQEGLDWTGVPTKGGGEMVPFLLGGKIDFAWSGGVHNRYGDEMKVLLSMNATRLIASPEVPSIRETYGVAMPSEAVIVAPAGLPDAVAATLEAAIAKAAKDPDFVTLAEDRLAFPAMFVDGATLTEAVAGAVEGLRAVVAKTGG